MRRRTLEGIQQSKVAQERRVRFDVHAKRRCKSQLRSSSPSLTPHYTLSLACSGYWEHYGTELPSSFPLSLSPLFARFFGTLSRGTGELKHGISTESPLRLIFPCLSLSLFFPSAAAQLLWILFLPSSFSLFFSKLERVPLPSLSFSIKSPFLLFFPFVLSFLLAASSFQFFFIAFIALASETV